MKIHLSARQPKKYHKTRTDLPGGGGGTFFNKLWKDKLYDQTIAHICFLFLPAVCFAVCLQDLCLPLISQIKKCNLPSGAQLYADIGRKVINYVRLAAPSLDLMKDKKLCGHNNVQSSLFFLGMD